MKNMDYSEMNRIAREPVGGIQKVTKQELEQFYVPLTSTESGDIDEHLLEQANRKRKILFALGAGILVVAVVVLLFLVL